MVSDGPSAKRPSRLPLGVGLLLVASGWAAIGLAWWNASRIDVETGQLPYLVSGGFGGLGLLMLGAAGIVLDSLRQGRFQSDELLRRLIVVVGSSPEAEDSPEGDEQDGSLQDAGNGLTARAADGKRPARGGSSRRRGSRRAARRS